MSATQAWPHWWVCTTFPNFQPCCHFPQCRAVIHNQFRANSPYLFKHCCHSHCFHLCLCFLGLLCHHFFPQSPSVLDIVLVICLFCLCSYSKCMVQLLGSGVFGISCLGHLGMSCSMCCQALLYCCLTTYCYIFAFFFNLQNLKKNKCG